MHGENDQDDDIPDTELDDDSVTEGISDGDIAVDIDDDNIGDMSIEINVEELVAKIESADSGETEEARKVRDKLDKIREQQDDALDSTYNFDLDDDL